MYSQSQQFKTLSAKVKTHQLYILYIHVGSHLKLIKSSMINKVEKCKFFN